MEAVFFPFMMLFASIPFIFMMVAMLFGFAVLAFNIWMIIDCYKKDFKDRDLWLIILIVGMFLGYGFFAALIYYLVVKNKVA